MWYNPTLGTISSARQIEINGLRYPASLFKNPSLLIDLEIYPLIINRPDDRYYVIGAESRNLVNNEWVVTYAQTDRPLTDVKFDAILRAYNEMLSVLSQTDPIQDKVDKLESYGLASQRSTLYDYKRDVYGEFAQRIADINSCATVDEVKTLEETTVFVPLPSSTWLEDTQEDIKNALSSMATPSGVTGYATLADINALRQEILGHQDTHYITLDGVDDYISLTGTGNCMDLSHGANWTLGFTVDQNYVGNSDKFSPLQSGDNNWTLYNGGLHSTIGDAVNALHWNTASYAQGIAAGDKIILRADGTHVQFWWNNVQKHQATLGTVDVGEGSFNNLTIGNATTSATIGAVPNWNASIDNLLICADQALDFNEMAEFFNSNDFDNYSFKDTKMTDFVTMGEDEYPNITGEKGVVTGTLVNGTPDNFVERS